MTPITGGTVTTAARSTGTTTADDRADFDRLVAALPFDPMHPPEIAGEGLVMHLARVFDLDAVQRAHAEGRRIDEAAAGLRVLVREAHEELGRQRRAAHLTAARIIADGMVPNAAPKAVAAFAAARDRAEYLDACAGPSTPDRVADQRAAEALNAEPVTTAALILTYGTILAAHESVRQSLKLSRNRQGQAPATAVLRLVGGRGSGRSWIHGKSDEDRRHLARVEHLARQWADTNLDPAIRDRMGVS